MNWLETWFCSTSYWRHITEDTLLPWLIADAYLGDHLLEVGCGPGAATAALQRRAPRVTSLEYDHRLASGLARTLPAAMVVQADAASLPFADRTFSSAIAVLVLHHLRSFEQQDRAFAEIHRVLRPGGLLLAFEIPDKWLQRALHRHSTFVPVQVPAIPARLTRAGFARVNIQHRSAGFRFLASRAL
jgi:ubiquinone/menaquinone biosynthesis C-methylase UbiE